MRYLEIKGGKRLDGEIRIQGSKNAVLPILTSCILGRGVCQIENCPQISDVEVTLDILRAVGCKVAQEGHTVCVDATEVSGCAIPPQEAARTRSSVLFLGALLGRCRRAVLPVPGGCAIGARPVDLHRRALETLGVRFFGQEREGAASEKAEDVQGGSAVADSISGDVQNWAGVVDSIPEKVQNRNVVVDSIPGNVQNWAETVDCGLESSAESMTADGSGLRGAVISLPFPSVGATENSILAAVLAPGVTEIRQAAREPEIDELIYFLKLRGARIGRSPDGTIRIEGVKELYPVRYTMQADRIVTGTFLLGTVAAGGSLRVLNYPKRGLELPLELLARMGASVRTGGEVCQITCQKRPMALPYLETAPYPGFPTDLQSLFTAVLTRASGRSRIRETIFENRFQIVEELKKMGAHLFVSGDTVYIRGVPALTGAQVAATDLRSGAALVLAGLGAEGVTRVRNVAYIERGYEDICRDLAGVGAEIEMREDEKRRVRNEGGEQDAKWAGHLQR